ncbi:hypothetical protein PPYR_13520 [Photinus pyralis]|uniref:Multiple inositol polyphosphate phosphatase 1 n=1 Tax=Photinus pyralis TaxID=7054 RepID=A0A1Y1LV74_PHOPY|nr:hypothetical protein PPYR_13520 [Photinus pyralis]
MLYLPLITLCFFTGAECNFITDYEKHFGSKTPYRAVENNNLSTIEFEGKFFQCLRVAPPTYCLGCQPTKIWYIIRHGARTPTNRVLLSMKHNLPRIAQMIIRANS